MITRAQAICLGLIPAALVLQGCVAAAIPLVAGSAIARTATDGEDPSVEVERAAVSPASTPAPPQTPALTDAQIEQDRLIEPGETTPARRAFAASPALTDFVRYAGEEAFQATTSGEPSTTALLEDPGSLDGERVMCEVDEARPASILIDLDPGPEDFDPETIGIASPDLALSLTVLRSEGVEVAWISNNSAGSADIIREALSESGLDPDGEDRLLLLRYPGDRKQTRRLAFASQTCLIAIAGDDRTDFDELYAFINDVNAALNLEPLFGQGWFLISAPPPEGDAGPESATTSEGGEEEPGAIEEGTPET